MFKSILFASLIALASGVAIADEDDYYVMSMEDVAELDHLPTLEAGMEYARCRENRCYIMRTGEEIGQSPDGIYAVWPNDEE